MNKLVGREINWDKPQILYFENKELGIKTKVKTRGIHKDDLFKAEVLFNWNPKKIDDDIQVGDIDWFPKDGFYSLTKDQTFNAIKNPGMHIQENNEFKRMQKLAGLINENEEVAAQPESGVSAMRANYSTVLKPTNTTIENVDKALNDIENYGTFKTQSIRNASLDKSKINKAIEDHFGPSIPSKKKAALKLRGGEPFPVRTKQSLDDFMKQFTGKPKLLSWEIQGNTAVFKQGKNPQKKMLEDVISTVMDSAGIEYELTKKEEI